MGARQESESPCLQTVQLSLVRGGKGSALGRGSGTMVRPEGSAQQPWPIPTHAHSARSVVASVRLYRTAFA
jgi:hypothetical protein